MNSIDRDALIKFIPQKYISEEKKRFTALDIFDFEGVLDAHKVNTTIRLDLIEPEKLQEFACRCAERALSRVENPDPRSVAAIAAKRAWVQGKMTDAELQSAWYAAYNAVLDKARANRFDALHAAMDSAIIDARDSAFEASWHAAWAASDWKAERTWQMEALKKMLREAENNAGSN